MTACGLTLFETPIGACAVVWSERGLVGVQLPEACAVDTLTIAGQRFPDARELPPTPVVRHAIKGIVALLQGEATDLSTIPLDMDRLTPFHRRVYEAARAIPPGATLSYGEIAARMGLPGAARAVGQALGRNPFPIVVPCHRVLAAGGRIGGFSAHGGTATKIRLLSIEGARAAAVPALFDSRPRHVDALDV